MVLGKPCMRRTRRVWVKSREAEYLGFVGRGMGVVLGVEVGKGKGKHSSRGTSLRKAWVKRCVGNVGRVLIKCQESCDSSIGRYEYEGSGGVGKGE